MPPAVYAYDFNGSQTNYIDYTCLSSPKTDGVDRLLLAGQVAYFTTRFTSNGTSGRLYAVRLAGTTACPADLDASGAVGIEDFLALLAQWGPCPGCRADLDGDGAVSITDFLAMLAAWGPC